MRKNKLLKKVVAMVSAVAMAVTMVPFVGGTSEVKAADQTRTFTEDTADAAAANDSFYSFSSDTLVKTNSDVTGYTKGLLFASKQNKENFAISFTAPSDGVVTVVATNNKGINFKVGDANKETVTTVNNVATYSLSDATGKEIKVWSNNSSVYLYSISFSNETLYNISLGNSTNGSITSDKSKAPSGASVSLTATPAEGYVIDTWSVLNGSTPLDVTANGNNASFVMPAANVSVSATFKVDPNYTPVVAIPSGQSISFSASEISISGDSADIINNTQLVSGYVKTISNVAAKASNGTTHSLELYKEEGGAIEFSVAKGTIATLEVDFCSSSASNNSSTGVIDKNGNYIKDIDGADKVTVTGSTATKRTFMLSEGTYKIVSAKGFTDRGARIKGFTITTKDADTVDTSVTPMLQYKKTGVDSATNKDLYSVRIVYQIPSTVNNNDGRVGLKLSGNDILNETATGYNVYSSLIANGQTINAEDGKCFVIVEIKNVPSDSTFTVTPFVEMTDASISIPTCNAAVVNMATILG